MSDDSLRYPTGRLVPKERPLSAEERSALIGRLETVPAQLRAALDGLTDEQLDTPYRDGGWSPRQIAHHIADSHLNSFVRFKLAMTEETPAIKPYDQARWADTPDVLGVPVESSLAIVDGLHERWVRLLRAMSPADFGRTLDHPESGHVDLDRMLQIYAWHGHHHVAQVEGLRERNGWW